MAVMPVRTFKNLYPRICAYDNLHLAWRLAARGKRTSPEVADFEYALTNNLLALEAEQHGAVPVACGKIVFAARPYTQPAPALAVGPRGSTPGSGRLPR